MANSKPSFVWTDPFLLEDQLTEDERMIRDSARCLRAGRTFATHRRGLS